MPQREVLFNDSQYPHLPTVNGDKVFTQQNIDAVKQWLQNDPNNAAANYEMYRQRLDDATRKVFDPLFAKQREITAPLIRERSTRRPLTNLVNKLAQRKPGEALRELPAALWDSAKTGASMDPNTTLATMLTPLGMAAGIGGTGLIYKSKLMSAPRRAIGKAYKALSHLAFPVGMYRKSDVMVRKALHDSDKLAKGFFSLAKRKKFKGKGKLGRAGAAILNLVSPLANKNLYKGLGVKAIGGLYSPGHGAASLLPGVQRMLLHNPAGLAGAALGVGVADYNLQKSYYNNSSGYVPGLSFFGSMPVSERVANIGTGMLGGLTGLFSGTLPRKMLASPIGLLGSKLGTGAALAGLGAAVTGGSAQLKMPVNTDTANSRFSDDFVGTVNNIRYMPEALKFRPVMHAKTSTPSTSSPVVPPTRGNIESRIADVKNKIMPGVNRVLDTQQGAPAKGIVDVFRDNDTFIPSINRDRRTTFKAIDKGISEVVNNRQAFNMDNVRKLINGRLPISVDEMKQVGDNTYKGMSALHDAMRYFNTLPFIRKDK